MTVVRVLRVKTLIRETMPDMAQSSRTETARLRTEIDQLRADGRQRDGKLIPPESGRDTAPQVGDRRAAHPVRPPGWARRPARWKGLCNSAAPGLLLLGDLAASAARAFALRLSEIATSHALFSGRRLRAGELLRGLARVLSTCARGCLRRLLGSLAASAARAFALRLSEIATSHALFSGRRLRAGELLRGLAR